MQTSKVVEQNFAPASTANKFSFSEEVSAKTFHYYGLLFKTFSELL